MIHNVGFLLLSHALYGIDAIQLRMNEINFPCKGVYGLFLGVKFIIDNEYLMFIGRFCLWKFYKVIILFLKLTVLDVVDCDMHASFFWCLVLTVFHLMLFTDEINLKIHPCISGCLIIVAIISVFREETSGEDDHVEVIHHVEISDGALGIVKNSWTWWFRLLRSENRWYGTH